MGEWTPAFKKGDREDAKTIATTITSLTAVDKIFEQLLSHQVICHCNKTDREQEET